MHSLNHQVDQHLFKITIPHYKQSFLRQRTAEPGGPASAADRKDGEAGVGGVCRGHRGQGVGRSVSSSLAGTKLHGQPRNHLCGMGDCEETPFGGRTCQWAAPPSSSG